MKYIYNYTELFLNESFNSKEAKKKFLDKDLITKKDYTIIKKAFLPKYVYWGCREKANPENNSVILDSIYDVTLWFEKSKQYLKSKDLYSYTYEEIRLLMNDPSIGPKKKKTKGQGDYTIVDEDDQGNIIVHVKDHTASVYWAHKYMKDEIADGQWCTASYNAASMFNNYSQRGPILIHIFPNSNIPNETRLCSVFPMSTGYSLYDRSGKQMMLPSSSKLVDMEYYAADDSQLSANNKKYYTKNNNLNKYIKGDKNIDTSALSLTTKDIPDIKLMDCIYIYNSSPLSNTHLLSDGDISFFQKGPLYNEICKYIHNTYKLIDMEFLMGLKSTQDGYSKLNDVIDDYIKEGFEYIYVDEPGNGNLTNSYYIIVFSKTKITNSFKYGLGEDIDDSELLGYERYVTGFEKSSKEQILNKQFPDKSYFAFDVIENKSYFDSYKIIDEHTCIFEKNGILISFNKDWNIKGETAFLKIVNKYINDIIDMNLHTISEYITKNAPKSVSLRSNQMYINVKEGKDTMPSFGITNYVSTTSNDFFVIVCDKGKLHLYHYKGNDEKKIMSDKLSNYKQFNTKYVEYMESTINK